MAELECDEKTSAVPRLFLCPLSQARPPVLPRLASLSTPTSLHNNK